MPVYCGFVIINEIGRNRVQSELALLLVWPMAIVTVLLKNRLNLRDIIKFGGDQWISTHE